MTMDQPALSQEDRDFLSAGIATTHHRLASMLGDLELNGKPQDSSFTYKSHYLAALIYINLSLREISPNAEMHHIMVSRLRAFLEEGGSDITVTWKSSLERLLWVAFIGGAAARKWPERIFFVQMLRQLKDLLLVSSLSQFQEMLQSFGCLRVFSKPHSRALWFEMEAMTRVE
jgi:hypothetical protein